MTTPNSGFTGNTLSDGTVAIDRPGWLAAYNVLHRMPEDISGLITGLRLVFYRMMNQESWDTATICYRDPLPSPASMCRWWTAGRSG